MLEMMQRLRNRKLELGDVKLTPDSKDSRVVLQKNEVSPVGMQGYSQLT